MSINDRTGFIGGSDIAAILGISPWKTAVDLWLDKIALPKNDAVPPVADTAPTRRGKRLERYVLDMIREEHGLDVIAANERHRDADVPYFAAEIDFEYRDSDTGDIENGEIKTVHPFKAAEWGALATDELPLHYVAQAQWGIGIKQRRRCRVFALIGDDLRPYVIERDAETIVAMRERAHDFWQRYVLPRLRPPIDYVDPRTLATLRRLYPGTDGSTIDANEEHARWRAVMKDAEAACGRYQAVADGARAHLLDAMGSAAVLHFADGKELRRKLIKRAGYTVDPCEYIDARIVTTKEQKA